MKKLLLIGSMLLLFSCVGKDVDPVYLSSEKDFVLREIALAAPAESCEYKGKVLLRFADPYQKGSARAIVDKSCEGELHMLILGAFGMIVAEISVSSNGEYEILQNGKAVDVPPFQLRKDDLQLFNAYFRLPPPLPDDSYDMSLVGGQYFFTKKNSSIAVSPGFRVVLLSAPDHAVEYAWDQDSLSSIAFFSGGIALEIEFTDKWGY